MGRSEFENQLRGFLDKKPFQPFIIEEDDGEQILVTNRQAIGSVTHDSALFFDANENMRFIDCDNVIRMIAASPAETV